MKNQIKILAIVFLGLTFTLTSCSPEEFLDDTTSSSMNQTEVSEFNSKNVGAMIAAIVGTHVDDCTNYSIYVTGGVIEPFSRTVQVAVLKDGQIIGAEQFNIPANANLSSQRAVFRNSYELVGNVTLRVVGVYGPSGLIPLDESRYVRPDNYPTINNCVLPDIDQDPNISLPKKPFAYINP